MSIITQVFFNNVEIVVSAVVVVVLVTRRYFVITFLLIIIIVVVIVIVIGVCVCVACFWYQVVRCVCRLSSSFINQTIHRIHLQKFIIQNSNYNYIIILVIVIQHTIVLRTTKQTKTQRRQNKTTTKTNNYLYLYYCNCLYRLDLSLASPGLSLLAFITIWKMNEWMNEWKWKMDEWMNEWMKDEWLMMTTRTTDGHRRLIKLT